MAIEVPEFQKEISDIVKRNGVLSQRISYVPATGSISRFFEETAIADGAFSDPRNIAPTPTSPTRQEKGVLIKSLTNQINFGLFDLETTAQQGIFTAVKAKDLNDMVNGIARLHAKALWSGSDTVSGSMVGAGTTNQYVGLLSQITKTATIASGSSIVDGIRQQVAQLVNDVNYDIKPTAIYINPLALNYLEEEIKSTNGAVMFVQTNVIDVVAGVKATGIITAAGLLPLIPEPFLQSTTGAVGAIGAAPAGQTNYPFCVVSEDLIEYHYVGSKQPRVFQLGTIANLNEQYVGVQFGAPVVKQAGVAHVLGVVQR